MNYQIVPLAPIPAQDCKIVLGGQNCHITVYQKPEGLFVNIVADGIDIALAVIARDTVTLIARGYAGFIGSLFFIDTLGTSDPDYTGLGSRYQLVYNE